MPWKESSVMGERLQFVAHLLEGEEMSQVCRRSSSMSVSRLSRKRGRADPAGRLAPEDMID
jgi:hypothetical protein